MDYLTQEQQETITRLSQVLKRNPGKLMQDILDNELDSIKFQLDNGLVGDLKENYAE